MDPPRDRLLEQAAVFRERLQWIAQVQRQSLMMAAAYRLYQEMTVRPGPLLVGLSLVERLTTALAHPGALASYLRPSVRPAESAPEGKAMIYVVLETGAVEEGCIEGTKGAHDDATGA